jgi:hypothetical protein
MVRDCTATSMGQGAYDACIANVEKFMGDVVYSADILESLKSDAGLG